MFKALSPSGSQICALHISADHSAHMKLATNYKQISEMSYI